MISVLQNGSLTVRKQFRAEKFALNLSERQSTATITIGPEASSVSVGDWLMDEDEPGAGIVWRVKTIDTDYATNTRTLNCEHLIQSLRDRIMFGTITPGDMAGKKGATTCTAAQAATYILKQCPDWTLGSFGFSKSAPYNFNGDDLYSALETVSSSLLSAWWSYDFSSYPFKVSIRPQSTEVACEMRMDRNIRTLKRTVDRSRMFTRFYPIGKNNIHISGNYVSKNENLYGVVSKVETDGNKTTESELRSWAEERLNNHAEPIVTVSVTGLELSEATGEPLDRLTLGTMCRMPLPEFDTIISERITKLSWSDKISDRTSVTITLANQVEDVATILNNLKSGGGGSARAQAKKDEEDHAWVIDETDHVSLLAEAVAGEGADRDWSRVAQVMVDGNGIHQQVIQTNGRVTEAFTSINQLSESIELKVDKGGVISAINMSPESIDISASRINLTGYVTVTDLNAVDAKIDNLTSGTTRATYIKTTQFLIGDNYFTVGSYNARWRSFEDSNGFTHHYLGYD